LSAAAKKLNMSYRAAWGRLKASEERLGIQLVDRSQGKSMHLTKKAKILIDQFDTLEKETADLMKTAYQGLASIIESDKEKT
jgi:molybdate transport system regulatory protein